MNLIIIQARMDSKRFKGKVLKPLKNKPILSWVIESTKNVKSNTDVIVATSTNPEDDIIYSFCNEEKVNVFKEMKKMFILDIKILFLIMVLKQKI